MQLSLLHGSAPQNSGQQLVSGSCYFQGILKNRYFYLNKFTVWKIFLAIWFLKNLCYITTLRTDETKQPALCITFVSLKLRQLFSLYSIILEKELVLHAFQKSWRRNVSKSLWTYGKQRWVSGFHWRTRFLKFNLTLKPSHFHWF